MNFMNNSISTNPIIIGIDHGYGNIKTTHCCFKTGVASYEKEPTFKSNLLVYKDRYHIIGEEHKEFISDKMTDSDYYILTLAAIARELHIRKRNSARVHLAAGLPLTWVSEQKDSFKTYLLQNKSADFTFKGSDYHVDFVGADIFPQGFSAVADKLRDFKGINMPCDIGNGMMNVMYMSCSRIYNDYDGILHDYTKKHGLVWEQVFLPEQAPQEWGNCSVLWNAVEESEKTKDSRLAREFVVALPVELDKDQWKQLLTDFIQNNFVAEGMCADVSIHDTDSCNPHAHIMLTVRPLNEQGSWQYKTEKEYLCIKDGTEQGFTATEFKAAQMHGWEKQYPYKVGKKKVYMPPSQEEVQGYKRVSKYPKSTIDGRQNPITERWNSEEQLLLWRKVWANISNRYLDMSGHNERIDHRSHAARGLDEQPTIHEGIWAGIMEQKGMVSERRELNRLIRADNKLPRELKAAVTALSETGRETAPEIAAKLETLRDDLITSHYHSSFNKMQLSGIKEFLKKNKPLLSELEEVNKAIKERLMERKALSNEKNKRPAWEVGKQIQMNRQYTTLTEDIEELKNRKVQILAALGCKEGADVKVIEKKASDLKKLRVKLEAQQKILQEQWRDAVSRYTDILNAIAPEDLQEIEKERRNIRYGGRTELIQKLHGKYGDRFICRQYDISEKAVDETLPTKKITREKRSISEQLQKEPQHKARSPLLQRRNDWER